MHLLILPGFALRPQDYAPLTQLIGSEHTVEVMDIWPDNVDEIRNIGRPGSPTFNEWLRRTTTSCAQRIEAHDTVVIAHSAGAEIARRIEAPVISIGCTPVPNAILHLHGETDRMVPAQAGAIVVPGGHFGCVTEEGMKRSCTIHAALSGKETYEEKHVDASEAVARHVRDCLQLLCLG